MDSGNSGSMSSSGDDQEYDSRADSNISPFFNPLTQVGRLPNITTTTTQPPPPHPPPDHHPHHHSSSMFDPLSNYFDIPRTSNPNNPSLLNNLDMVFNKSLLRSDPDLGNFIASASASASATSPTQQFFTNQTRPNFPLQIPPSESSTRIIASGPSNDIQGSNSNNNNSSGNPGNINNNNNLAVRNPKKRSRASRRAPTTVLTTDTTNFRAMVQEFTGIPAPPFTSSSPFSRARLDLFGCSTTASSSTISSSPSHPFLLRPFPQKVIQRPPQPFLSTNIALPPSTTTNTTTNNNINNTPTAAAAAVNTTATNSINYQVIGSDLSLLKNHIQQPPQPPQNLFNMQNPILNFHPLLQSPKFPLNTNSSSALLAPTKETNNDPLLKMGALEEFGLGHHAHNLGGLHNIVSSSSETALGRNETTAATTTTGTTTATAAAAAAANSNNWGGDNESDHHEGLLRSVNGNYSKGPENVGALRSEGMVESWICSSD